MRHAILAALLAAALLAGCGDSDDDTADSGTVATGMHSPAGEPTDTIRIADFLFDPKSATVAAGQRITIPNEDDAPHTLTDAADARAFDSGTILGKATGSVTISEPGTYQVYCELHPLMKGAVTVTG